MSYSNDPHKPEYCCNYIDPSYCITDPSDFFGGDGYTPKSIIVGGIIAVVFYATAFAVYWLDKYLRTTPTRWYFLKKFILYPIPAVILISMMFVNLYGGNQNIFNLLFFYAFYGSNYSEVACYLAYFGPNSPLYGNIYFLSSISLYVWLLMVAFYFRPKWTKEVSSLVAEVIVNLPIIFIENDGDSSNLREEQVQKVKTRNQRVLGVGARSRSINRLSRSPET